MRQQKRNPFDIHGTWVPVCPHAWRAAFYSQEARATITVCGHCGERLR